MIEDTTRCVRRPYRVGQVLDAALLVEDPDREHEETDELDAETHEEQHSEWQSRVVDHVCRSELVQQVHEDKMEVLDVREKSKEELEGRLRKLVSRAYPDEESLAEDVLVRDVRARPALHQVELGHVCLLR